MADKWVTTEELKALEADAHKPPMAMRFHDDNDSYAFKWMNRVRTFATVEARNQFVERSKKSNYMGRKRHRWFPVSSYACARKSFLGACSQCRLRQAHTSARSTASPERESEASRACDEGYMNDMRFGDSPDY